MKNRILKLFVESNQQRKIGPVYHGTNAEFDQFNLDKTAEDLIWFSEDKNKILKGESGAEGTNILITANIIVSKVAGWDEYDKYYTDELISKGYDAIKLDDDWVVFDPSQIEIINREEIKSLDEGPTHARSYKTPDLYHQELLNKITTYAKKKNLPAPKEKIAVGTEATIFSSSDPDIIIRAEHIKNKSHTAEYQMKDLESTGGVARIYHIETMPVRIADKRSINYVVSWKETVDTDVESYVKSKIKNKEELMDMMSALYFISADDSMEILKKYPETKGLALAVEKGLDDMDLNPRNNLGVTKDDRIVAFDS